MPHLFTTEQLNLKREHLKSLNGLGIGLDSAETKAVLRNLSTYFSFAASGLERALGQGGTRKQKELALYMKQLGEAFQNLQKDNVLEEGPDQLVAEQNSDFERAMMLLADLPAMLQSRDENNRLLFELADRHGAPAMGENYDKNRLLNNIESLDRLFDLGLTGLRDGIERESSQERQEEYRQQRQVLDFKQDLDVRMAAQLLDPGSEVSGTLDDLIKVVNPAFSKNVPLYEGAVALRTVAAEAAQTTDPIARRALIIRAAQQLKLVRRLYDDVGFGPKEINLYGERKNVVFPPKQEDCDMTRGDALLGALFDERDPRVRDQLRALYSPGSLEIPAGVDAKRALLHLVPARKGNLLEGSPDFALLDGTIHLLSREYEDLPNAAQTKLRPVNNGLINIRNFLREQAPSWDRGRLEEQAASLKEMLRLINENLEEFYKTANSASAKAIREIMEPLAGAWRNMRFEEIPKRLQQEGEAQPEPPAPKSYEQPDPVRDDPLRQQAEAEQLENRVYSAAEIQALQSTEIPAAMKRMARSGEVEALRRFRQEMTSVVNLNSYKGEYPGNQALDFAAVAVTRQLNTALSHLEGIRQHPDNEVSVFNAAHALGDLRDAAENLKQAADSALTDAFRTVCLDHAKRITKLVDGCFRAGPDPLKSYIAYHAGQCVGQTDQAKLRATARTAAAYQWAAENAYRPGGKVDAAKLNSLAVDMLKDPVFREYFRNRTKQPAANAQPGQEEKYPVNIEVLNKNVHRQRPQDLLSRLRSPMTYGASRDKQLAALKALRELGDALDHCSGAGKAYKRFFHSLKDLSLLDIDKMSGKELGGKLDEIFRNTENYMRGRKSVSWLKSRREHFEQALDALACMKEVSPSAEALINKLVKRTNTVRRNRRFKQPTVSLDGRNAEKTAKRLAASRGIRQTEQSNDIIALTEKQLRDQGLTKASEVGEIRRLPALPGDVKQTVKLEDLRAQFRDFLAETGENYGAAGKRIPEMLALTITAAYRKDGEAVLDKAQYERNVRVLRQHLATGVLVAEYSKEHKRLVLRNKQEPNKAGVLRAEFNEKDRIIRESIDKQERVDRGLLYGLDADQEKQLLQMGEDVKLSKNEQLSLEKYQQELGLEPREKPVPPKQDQKTLNRYRERFGIEAKEEAGQAELPDPAPVHRASHL